MPRSIETLAQRLKLARTRRGLSQEVLADLTRLGQSDISKLERGDMKATTGMARLVRVLRVSDLWLEEGEGAEPDWSSPGVGENAPTSLAEALNLLGTALAAVPKEMREAVATNMAGWARDAGADHWRRAVLSLLATPAGKRSGTHA